MIPTFLKKNKFIFLSALALLISVFYIFILSTDISIVTPIKSKTNDLKAYITFSHGDAYDANANYALTKAINKKFDILISYKLKHIDQAFFAANKHILNQKRGSGYWLWKPYFILKTLESLPEGSIVMYNDAGLSFTGDIDKYIEKMTDSKKDLVFFFNFHTNRKYIKKETYKIMDMNEKYRDDLQLDARSIIIKKSPQSMKYIKQWLDLCTNERLLTDKKFSTEPEFEDFIDHRHDQAILTLLHYKDPTVVLVLHTKKNDGYFHHRRRNIKDFSLALVHIRKNVTLSINHHIHEFKNKFIHLFS